MEHLPKTLLKVLVGQRNWRYSDFERAFDSAARRVLESGSPPTVGESQFRRWTGGKLKGLPGPDTCHVLEVLFETDAAALFAPPSAAAATTDVSVLNLEDEIIMTAREVQDEASATAAASISDIAIDQLRDETTALARTYHEKPAFDVWRQAIALRRNAEDLRERTQIPGQEQELLILTGQSAALLSAAAFDLGSLSGAKSLARTAALYGETARFGPLRAFAEGSLAYISYFSSEPSRALAYAQHALTRRGLGDVATCRLRSIEGRAHGHLGNTVAARRAILLSEEDGSGRRDDLHDGVGGEFGFTPERLAMSNSSTALLIGDTAQAEVAAERALALIDTRAEGSLSAAVRGGASADLALARLLGNDVDGAAEALKNVWTVRPEQRGTGLLARTAQVRRLLAVPHMYGTPLAMELCDRIENFIHTSASRQIGVGASDVLALES